jgi:hypothetical protein
VCPSIATAAALSLFQRFAFIFHPWANTGWYRLVPLSAGQKKLIFSTLKRRADLVLTYGRDFKKESFSDSIPSIFSCKRISPLSLIRG